MIPRTGERPKTIVLKGDLSRWHEEGRASETGIKPGMLLDVVSTSTGAPAKPELVKKHATAGKDSPVRIVKEQGMQGKTINDAYALNDIVEYHNARPGDVVLCRVAAAAVILIGAQLGSAGNGLFAVSGTKRLVEAGESIDNTDGVDEGFIRCIVL